VEIAWRVWGQLPLLSENNVSFMLCHESTYTLIKKYLLNGEEYTTENYGKAQIWNMENYRNCNYNYNSF
jgi:hypothetical protein